MTWTSTLEREQGHSSQQHLPAQVSTGSRVFLLLQTNLNGDSSAVSSYCGSMRASFNSKTHGSQKKTSITENTKLANKKGANKNIKIFTGKTVQSHWSISIKAPQNGKTREFF